MNYTPEQWTRLSLQAEEILARERIEPVLECGKCRAETSFRLLCVEGKGGEPELFRLVYQCFHCGMFDKIIWQREPVDGVGH